MNATQYGSSGLTAAHKKLPFGKRVQVTKPRTVESTETLEFAHFTRQVRQHLSSTGAIE
jgi:hypothetical protein